MMIRFFCFSQAEPCAKNTQRWKIVNSSAQSSSHRSMQNIDPGIWCTVGWAEGRGRENPIIYIFPHFTADMAWWWCPTLFSTTLSEWSESDSAALDIPSSLSLFVVVLLRKITYFFFVSMRSSRSIRDGWKIIFHNHQTKERRRATSPMKHTKKSKQHCAAAAADDQIAIMPKKSSAEVSSFLFLISIVITVIFVSSCIITLSITYIEIASRA